MALRVSQAERSKAEGNEYFSKGKLGAAIDAYTEAITLCPSVPVYWTNRAVCYRKKNEWEKVRDDCRKALELDKTFFKAQWLLGSAFLNLKLHAEAIRTLTKAVELGLASGLPAGHPSLREAAQELFRAEFEQWQEAATERRRRQRSLREHLQRLLTEDYRRQAQLTAGAVVEDAGSDCGVRRAPAGTAASSAEQDRNGAQGGAGGMGAGPTSAADRVRQLEEQHLERLNTLENVFNAAEAPDIPGEIPEHLCCKITMDVLQDPVITPYGITYERAVLLDHLRRGRAFDPVTRQPLTESNLAPNLAIREAVQEFLSGHGWAYQSHSPSYA